MKSFIASSNCYKQVRLVLMLCVLMCTTKIGKAICFAPHSFSQTANTTSSISFEWSDFSTASDVLHYEISFTLLGESPDLNTYEISADDFYTLENLEPSSTYEIRIRTMCNSGTTSWSSPFYVYTEIDPSFPCDVNLQIDDNSCSSGMMFRYPVEGQGDALGENAFIREIRITIDHDWPADLECAIINPAGDRLILFQDKGIGSKDVGIVSASCEMPLRIDMSACMSVNNTNDGLKGSLRPQGDMEILYTDSTNPNGDWFLEICDDANGQIGILKTFEIVFEEELCEGPTHIGLSQISENSVDLIIPESSCDSIEILVFDTDNQDSVVLLVPCENDTITINDLTADQNYTFQYTASCSSSSLSSSCPTLFSTYCNSATLQQDFDTLELCNISCAPCNTGDLFQNITENQWMIGSGATNTDLTGPKESLYNSGRYIFIESSENCSDDDYILQSGCLQFDEKLDCNISFYYHMNGADINSLALEFSLNNGQDWYPMWEKTGSQSDSWQRVNMDMNVEVSSVFQLRFRASKPNGELGDIALDNIRLSGISALSQNNQVYYLDEDEDGFGSNVDSIFYCGNTAPIGYSAIKGDCNDDNPMVNPESDEIPCNGIDDNCNDLIDEDADNLISYEILVQNDQSCNTIENGEIILEASGGDEPYTILWNTGQESFTLKNLAAGDYFATISDANNCTIQTDTITIDVLPSFTFLINSTTDATCLGYSDGSIEIFHDETNGPFTYQWSNGAETKDLMNVEPGMYSVQIFDVNSCSIQSMPIEITSTQSTPYNILNTKNLSCYNSSDGSIEIAYDSSYADISWDSGQDSFQIQDLDAGIYKLTITDSVGCQVRDSIQIYRPDSITIDLVGIENVSCYGENDGSIEVELSGGTGQFTYQWSVPGDESKLDLLTAGNYSLSVYDENNCENDLENIEITEPDSLEASIISITEELCTASNASIDIIVQGGNPTYNFQWSQDSTQQNLTGLEAGLYSVTVTDKKNCRVFLEDIQVERNDVIIEQTLDSISMVICNGEANGSLALSLSGITNFPVKLDINDSINALDVDFFAYENLEAQDYIIKGIDANGCLINPDTISVGEPEKLSISVDELESVSCGEAGGRIKVIGQGGTMPYSYDWSTQDQGDEIDSLLAGEYSVIITDANLCIDSLTNIEITSTSPLQQDVYQVNAPSCFGDNNGEIEIQYSGGVGKIELEWNGVLVDEINFDNLSAGSYNIVVRDSASCNVDSLEIELVQPEEIIVELDSVAPSYCGNANGFISLTSSGGTGNLSYTWTEGVSDTLEGSNLDAGFYDIVVIDENACAKGLESIEVMNVDKDLDIEILLIDSTNCFNSATGKIFYDLLGDFEYPLQTTLNDITFQYMNGGITNIPAGNYTLSVVDAVGCSIEVSEIEIASPPPINFSYEIISPIICHDDTTGIIKMTGEGGTGKLDYLWDNGDSGQEIINLGPGYYRCAIKDEKNCLEFTDSIYLENPDTLIVEITVEDATNGENNGSIYVNTMGGVEPYEYNWNYDLPKDVDTISFLGASDWELLLVDANGCSFDTIFTVQNVVNIEEYEKKSVKLYPNPTGGEFYIQSEEIGECRIVVRNELGQVVLRERGDLRMGMNFSVAGIPSGLYFVEMYGEDWVEVRKLVKE